MSMGINTNHPEALALVSDAMSELDHYKQSKELKRLILANDKLEKAISLDPKCMRSLFYGAMVNDLVGKPKDAVEKLKKLLALNPPSADEVEYNLAVAYYHQYSHKWLEKADGHFRAVIDKSKNATLKLLAHAGLAQTHAMWIIQRDPEHPDERAAHEHFSRSEGEYNLVTAEMEKAEDLYEATRSELKWIIFNARGMSLMYYTDYFENQEEKIRKLEEALTVLREADRYSPKNWANYCDLGSAYMRLGHWRGVESDFQMALQHLREVVTTLRPNYGFALYEIGRAFRLIGEFGEAINWFNAALDIDPDYRDVGDYTVNREKDRAAHGYRDFP